MWLGVSLQDYNEGACSHTYSRHGVASVTTKQLVIIVISRKQCNCSITGQGHFKQYVSYWRICYFKQDVWFQPIAGIIQSDRAMASTKVTLSGACMLQLSSNFYTSEMDCGCSFTQISFQGWNLPHEGPQLPGQFPKRCWENMVCHLSRSQCLVLHWLPTQPTDACNSGWLY